MSLVPFLHLAILGFGGLVALVELSTEFARRREIQKVHTGGGLDPHLDAFQRSAVLSAVQGEKDARFLRAFAGTLKQRGYPRSSALLTARAKTLKDLGPKLSLDEYPLEYWFGSYRAPWTRT
jgi:hypothetical protein